MESDAGETAGTAVEFVGRETELERLVDAADTTVEQGSQLVVVSGEAGIGKTSLVSRFQARIEAIGWHAHVGHCVEYGSRPLPFGPIVSILRSLVEASDDVEDLVGSRRRDLARLLPELAPGGTAADLPEPELDRLFDAIAVTLTNASRRRPVAVIVEDVHWADTSTCDLLSTLTRSLGPARVLIIVTERSGAVGPNDPLRIWLAEMGRLRNTRSMALEGFEPAEVAELATSLLGAPPGAEVVDDLLARAGGNPYFCHELLVARRSGRTDLPTSLVEFLAARVARLDERERELVRTMAVIGEPVDHRLLAAVAPRLDVGPLLRGLYDTGLVRVDTGAYALNHALLGEVILLDVLPFEAEELHGRVADALTSTAGTSSFSGLARVAVHWGQARDPDRSVAAATAAADAASRTALYGAAADLALQALAAWPDATDPEASTGRTRDRLLGQAVDWLSSCFREAEALPPLSDALATWATDLPADRRALLLARLGQTHWNLGDPGATAGLFEEASLAVAGFETAEAATVHQLMSKQALAEGQIGPAETSAERAIGIAQVAGPPAVLAEALTTRALAAGVAGDVDAGLQTVAEARRGALAEGLMPQVARTYRTEAVIIGSHRGRTSRCLEVIEAGLRFAEEHCGPRWQTNFRLELCQAYVEAGHMNEARPLIELLLDVELDELARLTILHTAAAHALATDRLDDAGAHLEEAGRLADAYRSPQETGHQLRLLAELARLQGRVDDAVGLVDEAVSLHLAADNLTYTRESVLEQIRIVRARFERGDDVRTETAGLRALADELGGSGDAHDAFRALMYLELDAVEARIDPDTADGVVTALEAVGYLHEAARARLLLVERLASERGSDRAALEADVTALHDVAVEHGMLRLAAQVEELARRARLSGRLQGTAEPARQVPDALPHNLTAREIEVMSLLAEGLTNKDIGEQLYVSSRTVSTHVSNLLAKLGLTNRGQAAAAYHKLALEEVIDLRDSVQTEQTRS